MAGRQKSGYCGEGSGPAGALVQATAWRRALLAAALLPVMMLASALAPGVAKAESAAGYMQKVANELIAAQRKGSEEAFARAIRSHADVPSIGLFSLGSYASGLARSDRSSYYTGMVKFISRYAGKEAPKYPVARAVMVGQSEETRQGVFVDSAVTLQDGTTYDVRWHLIRRGKVFKVRDAQVIGFWMSPFLKNLFENYISENGGNPKALVIALNR